MGFILSILVKKIKKPSYCVLEKIEEGVVGVKIEKKYFDRFLLTQEHSGLILFLPYLSCTSTHPFYRIWRGISRSMV
jgi:hypothetical protein